MRVARICTECNTRVFDDPDWKCDRHPTKTITQANRPYQGEPTPKAPKPEKKK